MYKRLRTTTLKVCLPFRGVFDSLVNFKMLTSIICPCCYNMFLSSILQEKMAETSTSDGPATGADFDMMSALDWKDGIATLPGSDIRVQIFSVSEA